MKVLVSGGTGFLGSALVRHLIANHYDVRILARHKKNRFSVEGLDVEIVDGDIIYPDSVEKAMRGCSVVFDLAAIYTFYPFWEKEAKALYKVNVQGTINMLNAALKHKVDRFIHTSTIATIGRCPSGKPSDEDTEFDFRNASHYARSKYLAEQEVMKFCKMGLPAVILNPGIVIGERDYKPTPSGEVIVKFLNRMYPAYFNTTWTIADADDVAKAHITAIKNGRIGERYILCNKTPHTLREIFMLLEKISGVSAPRIKIPYPLLYIFTHIDEFVSYRLLKKKPIMPTEGVKFCRFAAIYDNSRATKELSYMPTPIQETLLKAVRWYRMNGYVEPRGLFRFRAHGSKNITHMMRKIGIYKYTDKLNLGTLLFFYMVRFALILKKAGLKPKEDGWRRVTQSYLRTEHSKFILTGFQVNPWSDSTTIAAKTYKNATSHVINRLARFLKNKPVTHWQIEWRWLFGRRLPKKVIDIVHVEFDSEGNIKHLEPYFDDASDPSSLIMPEIKHTLVNIVKTLYNRTKKYQDKKRPLALKKELNRWVLQQMLIPQPIANQIIDRILSAVFVHFEQLPPPAPDGIIATRFESPRFILRKHPGFGLLNICCRITHDCAEVDFWIQYNHIPVDGVPMQEVINDLKREWGRSNPLQFYPITSEKHIKLDRCSSQNRKNTVYQITEFIDFHPFLQARRELNKKFGEEGKGGTTIAALLVWRLSQYRVFEDLKFAIPIDLRATPQRERTLGLVFIRPSIFFDSRKQNGGYLKFQQEFNRQLRATIRRKSESYALLESYALFPPFMYSLAATIIPGVVGDFVGTIGLTIIKKAEIFIGPFTDIHRDGFIAISNLLTPSADGTRVCAVSVKGTKDKIIKYMETIREIAGSGQ